MTNYVISILNHFAESLCTRKVSMKLNFASLNSKCMYEVHQIKNYIFPRCMLLKQFIIKKVLCV